MVKGRVATGCSNTNTVSVSIFRFPKDPGSPHAVNQERPEVQSRVDRYSLFCALQ